jgi:hypothetical protein
MIGLTFTIVGSSGLDTFGVSVGVRSKGSALSSTIVFLGRAIV